MVSHLSQGRFLQILQAGLVAALLAMVGFVDAIAGYETDRDGYWWELRGYLREFGSPVPRSKLCPDCAHEIYAVEQQSVAPISR
jgi:hypothetical protein